MEHIRKHHIIICIQLLMMFSISIAISSYGPCTTPNRERGECMKLQNCTYLFDIFRSPQLSLTDRRFLQQSQCGYYNKTVLICCPERFFKTEPKISFPQSQILAATAHASHPSTEDDLFPEPPNCGRSLSDKIYGGNITSIDEFPWMALIEYTKPNSIKAHYCGGALITSRYVLTAAHCVNGRPIPKNWQLTGVRLGEWDTRTNPDCTTDSSGARDCAPSHLDIAVSLTIPHPDYTADLIGQHNDIALLQLAERVEFTDFIKPICLPTSSDLRGLSFTGYKMDVAGWGQTETGSDSNMKLKATVDVWDLERCKNLYSRFRIDLQPSQMCAGGAQGIDSCRGDSGGPLMVLQNINHNEIYIIAGIVSFGTRPCALRNWAGVYTRVGYYVDWIRTTIRTQ